MLKYYNYDIVFQEIPGEVTLAINITNCPFRCKGCHSPHLREDIGEELSEACIHSLMDKYASAVTCFCFMGGDSDPPRVAELSGFLRKHYPTLKTAWYSGAATLPQNFTSKNFHFIKLGGYMEEKGTLKSDGCNQHLFEIQQDGSLEDVSYLFIDCK